jgi:processive 1,2-diacylglycerol beta-glucosyltransferase
MSETPAAPAKRLDVLILTASVGTGHNQAARAIHAEFTEQHPELNVEVRDVLDFAGLYFRTKYATGYTLSVTRFPRFYGLGFNLTDRPSGPGRTLGERWKLLREGWAMRRLIDFVAERQPRLILHTHMLAPPLLSRAMRQGQLPNIEQRVIVTDIHAHRWWYAEDVEHWYLPQEATAEQLRRWKIEPQRWTVSGIPIMPKWSSPLADRQALCDELDLPVDRPIVLLSGGAEFTCGPVIRIARGLAESLRDVCVVALAGRNKALLSRLWRLSRRYAGQIVPMGFTDRMHELSALASLLVTKPGGIITSESLAKGTPMLFLRPVPGQEAHNAAFLVEQGAGIVAPQARDAISQAAELLGDLPRLAKMAESARALHRPGRETIVAEIIERLGSSD